jgi:GT2 family glycosyltransferase
METRLVRIGVLVVAFNGVELLDDCLSSVLAADATGLEIQCILFDNASSDGTSILVRERFPNVRIVESSNNLGFAEGNNQAVREAERQFPDFTYFYLLNQDTIVDRKFLVEAVRYLEEHPTVGAAQSLLLLHPETNLINTAGNALHFLGFGLPTHYREPLDLAPHSGPIGYPSGASVLIRAALVRSLGLFTADLFMYLEDAELGVKLHLLGQPPHLCRESVVYHKYQYSSGVRSYQFLERNRWWLLVVHYRLPTLVLLLPAILAMEAGQFLYALQHGLLRAKLLALWSFVSLRFLRQTLHSRRFIQSQRTIGDAALLKTMTGVIESPHLSSPLLRYVANPILATYLHFLIRIVRW